MVTVSTISDSLSKKSGPIKAQISAGTISSVTKTGGIPGKVFRGSSKLPRESYVVSAKRKCQFDI